MRKKGLVILLLLVIIGLSGCELSPSSRSRKIEAYLKEKYDCNFSFVAGGGYDATYTDRIYTYQDEDGNRFKIWYSKISILDGYGSILYDEGIQDIIQEIMGPDYKVFCDTKGTMTGSKDDFSNAEEYMQQCTYITVRIFTLNETDYTQIAETLTNAVSDKRFSVDVCQTTENGYNTTTGHIAEMEPEDRISWYSFSVEGDEISNFHQIK